ncbi:MAG: TonB-dependent receptor [Alphaproteobacteria bacterium GM7ARS4]|nr:TonB-dependent receptor [Alphaproteobacteria bacterium GM7ARS4]
MTFLFLAFICLFFPLLSCAGEAMAEEKKDTHVFAPIEVTILRSKTSSRDVGASVSVVDGDESFGGRADTLGALLRSVPGVSTTGGPRLVSEQPNIRGLSGDRIVIRLDGARKNFSNVHRGRFFIDGSLLKRAEVLRGAGSVFYGSGALGGVIDLTTKSASDFVRDGRRAGVELVSSYDSNNQARKGSVHLYALSESMDVLFSIGGKRSGDYQDGDGNDILFSGENTQTMFLKSTWTLPSFHALELSLQRWRDHADSLTTPELDVSPVTTTVPAFARNSILRVVRRTTEDTFSLRHSYEPSSSPLKDAWLNMDNRVYMSRTRIDERGTEGDFVDMANPRNSRSGNMGRLDERSIRGIGFDISNRMMFSPHGQHTIRQGIDFYHEEQQGRRNTGAIPFPQGRQNLFGVYLHGRSLFLGETLRVEAGTRFDRSSQGSRDRVSRSNRRLSSTASLLYKIHPFFSPYASYGQSFRAPSLTELYVGGTHFLANRFVSNPSLRPERGRTTEVGLNMDTYDPSHEAGARRASRWHGKFAYFSSHYRDFIEQVVDVRLACFSRPPAVASIFAMPPTFRCPPTHPIGPQPGGTTTYDNVPTATVKGMEFALNYERHALSARLHMARIRGKDRQRGTPLSNIAADTLSLSLSYAVSPTMRVSWRSTLAAAQDRVIEPDSDPQRLGLPVRGFENAVNASAFTGLYKTPGYGVHDIAIGWTPNVRALKGLDVSFHVRNLFNKTYRQHTSAVMAQGLNMSLSLSQAF